MTYMMFAALKPCLFFFFNAPTPTEIYTLPLHDALPICELGLPLLDRLEVPGAGALPRQVTRDVQVRFGVLELLLRERLITELAVDRRQQRSEVAEDRKSTRLNSSHLVISYAVFCLKKNT